MMHNVDACLIVFLDFDGVLHPDGCQERLHFCRLPILEGAMRQLPQVGLVISSTWRDRDGSRNLLNRLAPDLRSRVLGVTPAYSSLTDISPTLVAYPRHAECVAWLHSAGRRSRPWIAVDDRPWNFKPFCPNLLVVNGSTGLQSADVKRLAERCAALS